jgi:hypothetical protein
MFDDAANLALESPAATQADAGSLRPNMLRPALFWAIVLSVYFLIVYNGCNWIASKRPHLGTLYFSWERHIPFVPEAIYPYMSIDLFFFFSPFLCRDLAELRTHAKRLFLAISLAAVCFLLFPLKMGTSRPQVTGVPNILFTLLGGFDKPYNLVPSLHIGLLCILWVIYSRHTRGVLRLLIQGWFLLIVASCVLTNQHHVIDLLGGYILGVSPGDRRGTALPVGADSALAGGGGRAGGAGVFSRGCGDIPQAQWPASVEQPNYSRALSPDFRLVSQKAKAPMRRVLRDCAGRVDRRQAHADASEKPHRKGCDVGPRSNLRVFRNACVIAA